MKFTVIKNQCDICQYLHFNSRSHCIEGNTLKEMNIPRNSPGSSNSKLFPSLLNCVFNCILEDTNTTPVLLPGKPHGRRSLVGCSPWGRWESDTTERLHFHFSLSCIGEGNGNPLQCSCLEHPRDGGAWWAAVYGVAQSRT